MDCSHYSTELETPVHPFNLVKLRELNKQIFKNLYILDIQFLKFKRLGPCSLFMFILICWMFCNKGNRLLLKALKGFHDQLTFMSFVAILVKNISWVSQFAALSWCNTPDSFVYIKKSRMIHHQKSQLYENRLKYCRL